MKQFIFFITLISYSLAADGVKNADVDFGVLFKQLDKAITKKKNPNNTFKNLDMQKKEKDFKAFNEAAKQYHLVRAKEFLKTISKMIVEYESKTTKKFKHERYAKIGDSSIAYASSRRLTLLKATLEKDGAILKNLKKYKNLLKNIKDFDIKLIAKVLTRIEQEIMDIDGLGTTKKKLAIKKDDGNFLIKLKVGDMLDNTEVISIDSSNVTLRAKYD
jgi:hypothetical protein